MKNILLLLSSIVLLAFTNCETSTDSAKEEEKPMSSADPVDNLHRVWRLTAYELLDSNGALDDKQKESLEKRTLRDGHQMVLIPSKTGNTVIGQVYEDFTWEYQPDAATITLKKKRANTILKNVEIKQEGKRLTLTTEEDGFAKLKFVSTSELADPIIDEPFHTSNNEWRIKATKYEEPSELKKRLLNFITHNKLLFKASIENPNRSFTNSKSNGIITVYKGAIGFQKESAIPTEWTYTFYDEYQAKDAYKLLLKYMKKKPMKKIVKGDWKIANMEILEELEAKIKADIEAK
ncbi:MAG: hypothetical protein AB8F74_03720 [Saprospiraceae bacterium]